MVLATDEVFTYAIFNYLEINWSSHTEAGGDTTTGEGGVPAYVSSESIFYSRLVFDRLVKLPLIQTLQGVFSVRIVQTFHCIPFYVKNKTLFHNKLLL